MANRLGDVTVPLFFMCDGIIWQRAESRNQLYKETLESAARTVMPFQGDEMVKKAASKERVNMAIWNISNV